MALERHGVTPERGPIVVTGAAGGVGSVAIAILSKLGFKVIAATGRLQEEPYLRGLGASEILDRKELSAPGKPLAKERWAGGIDSVGSTTLAMCSRHPLRRRGRGLRPRRRHGPPDHGRALYPARGLAARPSTR